MRTANVHEAKTTLSKLLDAAAAGEDVFITRNGVHFQLIAPHATSSRELMFGALKREIRFAADYDEDDGHDQVAAMFDGPG
jgi:antitoxin (DNA-binding transcriptional repressor) of toxin-antitoxin stability system